MEGSVGKALRDARLRKKLTVEEAARATKIRPERIADLERDEYARFPNLAYARGFLLLYAKYLGIDISKYQTLEVANPAGLGDYQYLQNEQGVNSLRFSREMRRRKPGRGSRWLVAFLVFVGAVIVGGAAGWLILNAKRLGSIDQLLQKSASGDLAAPSASPTPAHPAASATPAPTVQPSPAQTEPVASPTSPAPSASPGQSPVSLLWNGGKESAWLGTGPGGADRDADVAAPITPLSQAPWLAPAASEVIAPRALPADGSSPPPVATGDSEFLRGQAAASATPAPPVQHEIKIRARKRTRVKILQDDVKSDPKLIYNDWLTPGMEPLQYRGGHFLIRVRDSGARKALTVTSDGQPVTGDEPDGRSGVQIQTQ